MDRILLFIKTPPPTTGATLMNKRVLDSTVIRESFDIRSIEISYMKHRNEMGKWKLSKLYIIVRVLHKLLSELLFHRPMFVYFQISPSGVAFARDLVFVTVIKLFRVRILFHMHGKGIINKSKFAKVFYKYCFRSEYIIHLSSLLTYDLKDVYRGKVFIVPNGTPDSTIQKDEGASTRVPIILYLSNLVLSKGILDYIAALEILANKKLEFKGIIVGAEADVTRGELHLELRKRGLEGIVEYLGPRYDKEKTEIMQDSNIFIFPTKWECFPIVIIEAMQFGLPVISTNEAAIPEIIEDGVTGFLVNKDAPVEIAKKVEELMKNPILRIKMGKAGRKKYEEKYTLRHCEENMKKVFQQVLDKIQNNSRTAS